MQKKLNSFIMFIMIEKGLLMLRNYVYGGRMMKQKRIDGRDATRRFVMPDAVPNCC